MCAFTDSVPITATRRMPFVETRTCWKAHSPRTCHPKRFWRERRGGILGDAATTRGGKLNGKQVSDENDIIYKYLIVQSIMLTPDVRIQKLNITVEFAYKDLHGILRLLYPKFVISQMTKTYCT